MRYLFYLAFLLAGLLAAPFCFAFEAGRYTETEKAGLAFYKLGGFKPDFDSWVKQRQSFSEIISPVTRGELLRAERARLEEGLRSYDPERGAINIRTPVKMSLIKDKKLHIKIESFLKGGDLYFPFPVGRLWVTILPIDIEKYQTVPVAPFAYENIQGAEGAEQTGLLKMTLEPVFVNTEQPVETEGIETWLMSAKIQRMEIWKEEGRFLLWEYIPPSAGRSNNVFAP